ncbi:5,10-methylenetetrahydrofolate reductase (NAD(P)) [Hypnocyclicus thermotrophus]|uniref:Methylenetetrahydrofolate reductase n=1 Tax=Hypnocyclicus thermotrophus TaxID=1627895 RepID=A0AA46I6H8_9FUSO|nr:methylenetetrahydrofolate reductase [NAD(P)H] [Hypnocyclicus thermotrophus]TDT72564.1 5,10-methylenetetrahydrofolate reductase (NAD(P)) [Hypnocyclicus thermotrophus]
MKIKDIYMQKKESKKPVFSFEIFPPNSKHPIDTIYNTIDELSKFNPDFISVTYGAGGSTRGRTVEIASRIKNKYNIESLAHLTCIEAKKNEIDDILYKLKENNIENILALRGDHPIDREPIKGDFNYASDLITYIKNKNMDFSLGGAYYPEGHFETNDLMDLFNLKRKVDLGAEFLISQIFLDNEILYRFKEKTDKLGINVPFAAGIIPVTNAKQMKRIFSLSHCSISPKFKRILDKYEHNPEALKEAGIAYATEQIIDLVAWGIDGIHLYTMNKIDTTRKIVKDIEYIIK